MPRTPALAKLTRPRIHQAVARERLFSLLDSARDRPVVWVDAPPGSGKTTAVTTYLKSRAAREIWYQLDAGDVDAASFFHYLSSACHARHARGLPRLAPEHLQALPAFARRYFRAFFARESLLVLDNFQDADSLLADLLPQVAEEIPDRCNVLVISRTAPPVAFAALEARGKLSRLEWNDLRLTLDETRAMSAQRGVAEDWMVHALHEQASGWAAGVILMLERLKRAGDGSRRLSGDTRQSVFNYFASLIFDQAGESVQQTLLSLAFLPRMTAALAIAASGNPDAGRLLESLHRRQLFTDRRPGPDPIYQFHALFQEFLQTQLPEQTWTSGARLQRSARLLVEHGDWEPAFELLVRARAWEFAHQVLRDRAQSLLESGRWQLLVKWIDSLPDESLACDAWLQYWRGSALAQIDPGAAVPVFLQARDEFQRTGDKVGRILSTAGLLQVWSVDHVNYTGVEELLSGFADDLSTPGLLRADQELAALGPLLWSALFVVPWHRCITAALDRIVILLERVRVPAVCLPVATSALTVASQSAQMERSRQLRDIVLRLADAQDSSPLLACWGLFQVAVSYFLDANYTEAFKQFDRVWSLAQAHDLKKVLTTALMHRFMIDFRLSDMGATESIMKRIEALPAPTNDYSRCLLACYRGRYAQLQGRLQDGANCAQESQRLVALTHGRFHECQFGLINAEMLLHAGRVAQALPILQHCRELLQRAPFIANLAPSLAMVEAWAMALAGDRQGSRERLREALGASRAGYGWCHLRFVDTSLVHMLLIALEENIEADQARWLIRTFRLRPPSRDVDRWPWPLRLRTLGEFSVHVDELPLELGRKTPRKVLALLKALVAMGPREVPEQQLVDALWPDEEGDAGHKSLSITVLRLRRLLGDNQLVHQQGGKLSLDAGRCWIDAWSFERGMADCAVHDRSPPEKILALYGGAFLPDDFDAPFTIAARERLRFKFVDALGRLGRDLESSQRHEDAMRWYLRGLEADPIIEPFYQGLMRCYVALDRRTEAIAAYRRLKQTLSVTLGLQPSASTDRLYQSVRGDART